MFSSHHIDRDQYRYHICIFISSQLVVIDIGIDIVNIIIIILLHHISRDQYDIFVLFSSSLFYLISIDPSRRRGLSISSFVVILIVLIIITATCSWLLWSSFFSHHTIMIITIFFSFKSHRIYGTIVMITIFFLSITSYGRRSLEYSLIICHIDWSWSSLSFFKSTSYIIRYVIIVFFKITSYDRDHHLLLQTHFVRSWSSLSYFFFFTITSYNDDCIILFLLLHNHIIRWFINNYWVIIIVTAVFEFQVQPWMRLLSLYYHIHWPVSYTHLTLPTSFEV